MVIHAEVTRRNRKSSPGEKYEEKVHQWAGAWASAHSHWAAQGRAAGVVLPMGVGTGWKLTDVIHKSSAKLTAHTQLKNVSKQ